MSYNDITSNVTKKVLDELKLVVKGQDEFLQFLVVCLFSRGHVLIEGMPGLGKTLAARAFARVTDVKFSRIQFTPDMMPSDITGNNIYDIRSQSFHLKKGPIFTNFLLADEINRTPPKTQSALLEAMEEGSITIDGNEYLLDEPFMVFATQNPIEFEGTYPLPEAQLDRFLMKLVVKYPDSQAEKDILLNYHSGFNSRDFGNIELSKVLDKDTIMHCKQEISKIKVEESIITYITAIVSTTRKSPNLLLGASPRASIALLTASKTLAAIQGRDYVIPEDIKTLALPVLRHRIIVAPESEIEGTKSDDVIIQILNQIKVPR